MVFFYENPNPEATFFVYVKLLISLLNGAFFRLGDNFSVRGYGARFSATALHQLFKQMVGTPTARCAQPVWGKNNAFLNCKKKMIDDDTADPTDARTDQERTEPRRPCSRRCPPKNHSSGVTISHCISVAARLGGLDGRRHARQCQGTARTRPCSGYEVGHPLRLTPSLALT